MDSAVKLLCRGVFRAVPHIDAENFCKNTKYLKEKLSSQLISEQTCQGQYRQQVSSIEY